MVRGHLGDESLPLALPDPSGRDRLVDLIRTLVEDPAGSEGVMTDFGITHVAVRAETHGAAVCAKCSERPFPLEAVEDGRRRRGHCVVLIAESDADAIED